mmetsp:Transcript_17065/g.57445  ORF Transcript_17065/g.57445 Transcript_17065/m.57445 type:complete len:239 (+) Transcript_17065:1777-2493(+)
MQPSLTAAVAAAQRIRKVERHLGYVEGARDEQRAEEVGDAVRARADERDLRARHHHCLCEVVQEERQRRASEGHRVCAVQYDKGVPRVVGGGDVGGDADPLLLCHVGRVEQWIVVNDPEERARAKLADWRHEHVAARRGVDGVEVRREVEGRVVDHRHGAADPAEEAGRAARIPVSRVLHANRSAAVEDEHAPHRHAAARPQLGRRRGCIGRGRSGHPWLVGAGSELASRTRPCSVPL